MMTNTALTCVATDGGESPRVGRVKPNMSAHVVKQAKNLCSVFRIDLLQTFLSNRSHVNQPAQSKEKNLSSRTSKS